MGDAGVLGAVEREIAGERAGALTRAVEALEAALGALVARPGSEALAEARERLWCVVVQREALGLRSHEVLYEVLHVPAAVRLGMGPRPPARDVGEVPPAIPRLFG